MNRFSLFLFLSARLYIQECLEKLEECQVINDMKFNVGKFNVLKHGRNHAIKETYNYIDSGCADIFVGNETVCGLGVIVNLDRNYIDYVVNVFTKVSQQACLLLRTLQNLPVSKTRTTGIG